MELNKELRSRKDDGLYKGQVAYAQYFEKQDSIKGKASSNLVRFTICKIDKVHTELPRISGSQLDGITSQIYAKIIKILDSVALETVVNSCTIGRIIKRDGN